MVKNDSRWLYNFRNANYDELNYRLEEVNLKGKIEKPDQNVDAVWRLWSRVIHKFIDKYIPRWKIKHNTNPWVDGEALNQIHLKKKAWHRTCRSNSPADWETYKKT